MTKVNFIDYKGDEQDIIIMFIKEHRFLSNFYPCNVTLYAEGECPEMEFKSVENAYMAWKTLDPDVRKYLQSCSAQDAKDMSIENKIPLRQNYSNEGRLEIMRNLLGQKFSDKNSELKDKLLNTKNTVLIEGTTWGDSFFGVCLKNGHGENHLGRMLMEIRDRLLS